MLVPTTMQASHVSRFGPFLNRGLLHSKTLTNRHQCRHIFRIHAARLLQTNPVFHIGFQSCLGFRAAPGRQHHISMEERTAPSMLSASSDAHTHTHSRLGPSRMPTRHCGLQAGLLAQRFSCFTGRHAWLDCAHWQVRLDGAREAARFHTSNVCEADVLGNDRTEICS